MDEDSSNGNYLSLSANKQVIYCSFEYNILFNIIHKLTRLDGIKKENGNLVQKFV